MPLKCWCFRFFFFFLNRNSIPVAILSTLWILRGTFILSPGLYLQTHLMAYLLDSTACRKVDSFSFLLSVCLLHLKSVNGDPGNLASRARPLRCIFMLFLHCPQHESTGRSLCVVFWACPLIQCLISILIVLCPNHILPGSPGNLSGLLISSCSSLLSPAWAAAKTQASSFHSRF